MAGNLIFTGTTPTVIRYSISFVKNSKLQQKGVILTGENFDDLIRLSYTNFFDVLNIGDFKLSISMYLYTEVLSFASFI